MLDPSERSELNDFRERLAKSEANIENNEKNLEQYQAHTEKQFKSLGDLITQLSDQVSGIRMTLARWLGGGGVILFVTQLAIAYFTK